MAALRWALAIVGLIFLFFRIVFALQGADILGGSALMSGNPTYIYVGAAVALLGVVALVLGWRSASRAAPPAPAPSGK